jgi:hypothetical protein
LYIVSGEDLKLKECHAKYGAVDTVMFNLQSYANDHISRSFDYLLMVRSSRYLRMFLYLKIYYSWEIFTHLKYCVMFG